MYKVLTKTKFVLIFVCLIANVAVSGEDRLGDLSRFSTEYIESLTSLQITDYVTILEEKINNKDHSSFKERLRLKKIKLDLQINLKQREIQLEKEETQLEKEETKSYQEVDEKLDELSNEKFDEIEKN